MSSDTWKPNVALALPPCPSDTVSFNRKCTFAEPSSGAPTTGVPEKVRVAASNDIQLGSGSSSASDADQVRVVPDSNDDRVSGSPPASHGIRRSW